MQPTDDQIADRIDEWHDRRAATLQIYDALGWTEVEYAEWLRDPKLIPPRPLPPLSAVSS